MKLVGICGDIGSGKDTVADHLLASHDFEVLSFATKLKEWVFSLVEPLGVERRHIYGGSAETKQADQAEPLLFLPPRSKKGDELEVWTGRSLLEYLGTDVARSVDPDIWVRHLARVIERRRPFRGVGELRFVIPDVRFQNEFAMVQWLGGEVWRTRIVVSHGRACPTSADWRASCKCGATRSTGHESDEAWRFLDYNRLLVSPKPGVERLQTIADAHLKEMPPT
jgi:hypothetical protein